MTKTVVSRSSKVPRARKWQKLLADLKGRHDAAFSRLDPKVRAAKSSPHVQIAAGAGIGALLLAGRPISALALGAAWIGSKQATHAVAGAAACAGVLRDAAIRTITEMRGSANSVPRSKKPSKARRRWTKAKTSPAPAPAA